MVTEISTWQEFDAIRNNPSADYILVNDLTQTMADHDAVAGSWNSFNFSGTFDGQGNTVGPMEGGSYGVFNTVSGTDTVVKNVTFDIALSGSNRKTGFANEIHGGAVIDNVTIDGSITSTGNDAFGLARNIYDNSTEIKNCTINALISGTGGEAAGIARTVYNSTFIENCAVTGQVLANNRGAGVCIRLRDNSDIRGTSVSSAVQSSNSDSAGVVTRGDNSSVRNCTVTGDVLTSTSNGGSVAGIMYRTDVDNTNVDLRDNTVNCNFAARNTSAGILTEVGNTNSSHSLNIYNNDITVSFNIQEGGANGVTEFQESSSINDIEINSNDVTIKDSDIDYQSNFSGIGDRFRLDNVDRLEIQNNTVIWDFGDNDIDSIGDVYGVCRRVSEDSSSNARVYLTDNDIEFKQPAGGRDHLSVFGRLRAYSSNVFRVTDNYVKFKRIQNAQQTDTLFISINGNEGNPEFRVKRNGLVAETIDEGVEEFFRFNDNNNEQWNVRENFIITTEEYVQHDQNSPQFSGLYGSIDDNVDVRHGYSIHQSVRGESNDTSDSFEGLTTNINGTLRYHYSLVGNIELNYDSTNSEQIYAFGVSADTQNGNVYNNDSNIYPLTGDERSRNAGHHAALPLFFGDARNKQIDGSEAFDNNFDSNEWAMVQEGVPIEGYLPLSDGPPILKNADVEFQLEAFSNVKMLDFDYVPADTLTGSVSFDGVGVENSTVYAIESANDRLLGPKQTDANGDVSFKVDGRNNVIYLLADFEDGGDRFGRLKSINFDSS